MPEVSVRDAESEDIDFIVSCNVAMATETEDLGLNPDTLRQGIDYLMSHQSEGFYLVAEYGQQPVGTLMVTFEWSDWRNGRFWWIQSVYVAPHARRRGVYQAMHRAVRERAAKDLQACGIRLYVEQDNDTAQQTYQRIGMFETHYRLYEESIAREQTD